MKVDSLGITHRTLSGSLLRLLKILKRYGLSEAKMESNLRLYLAILKKNGVLPSFPITAKVLDRHHKIVRKLTREGVEFVIHGYKHVDHTRLSDEKLLQDLEKAIEIFQEHHIPFSGFRFPYLRWNPKCIDLLGKFFLEWDSSYTILWDVIPNRKFRKRNLLHYQNMLNQYNYKSSSRYISLPRLHNTIVEIPVSLPDDDLLERLGLTNTNAVSEIWGEILRRTHSRGELFTLQLHPERILILEEALESVIQIAKELYPRVWITSLGNIYGWWKEKENFGVKLKNKGNCEYHVDVNCSTRATVLVRSNYFEKNEFYDGYSLIRNRTFWIKSQKLPIVGISKDSPSELIHFLKNEGFIFEMSKEKEKYSVYLDNFLNFSPKNEMKALEIINTSNLPLIRLWRWPNGCRSALAITGDIDGLAILDFFRRFL